MVRLRQILDVARHRLIYLPVVSLVMAIGLSRLTLGIDGRLDDGQLPQVMETTVDSARSILAALAGGLISSVTLLLSLMLVAVQLASSQFSPRTLRGWIGDRTQQRAIAIVLSTVVYCLLILRETRTLSEGNALTPHVSVIVAVVLGIVSLVAVVLSVDHLTDRLRVGRVASGIMEDTVALIEGDERLDVAEDPSPVPISKDNVSSLERTPPADALPITSTRSGWVQQIDERPMVGAIPEGSTLYITATVGSFTFPRAPLAWIWPPTDDDAVEEAVHSAIALGDARTMQQDVGFGMLQMVDIALRALSPGVNDPNTANDLIAHLGVVMLALWERPMTASIRETDGRTVVRFDLSHEDFLHAAFDPLRFHGAGDPQIASTLVRTLSTLRSETVRRNLPGPIEPIDEIIDQIREDVDGSELSDYDKRLVHEHLPNPGGKRTVP